MMKGQLAGLMKQAQAMQDNLKKAQDELAHDRGRGPVGRRPGQGDDDLQARRQAHRHRPEPARPTTRTCSRTWSPPPSTTRVRHAEEVSQEKMGKLTAGMPLPPGMKLPF